MNVYVMPAWVVKRSGPGKSPCMIRPPKRIAAAGLPGTPRVRSGMIDPPTTAFLPTEAAMIPSGCPLPELRPSRRMAPHLTVGHERPDRGPRGGDDPDDDANDARDGIGKWVAKKLFDVRPQAAGAVGQHDRLGAFGCERLPERS